MRRRYGVDMGALDVDLLEIAVLGVDELVGGGQRQQRHVPGVGLGVDHADDDAGRLVLALQADGLDAGRGFEGSVERLTERLLIGPARIADEDALVLGGGLAPERGRHDGCKTTDLERIAPIEVEPSELL